VPIGGIVGGSIGVTEGAMIGQTVGGQIGGTLIALSQSGCIAPLTHWHVHSALAVPIEIAVIAIASAALTIIFSPVQLAPIVAIKGARPARHAGPR
jgi:hypothetical protein